MNFLSAVMEKKAEYERFVCSVTITEADYELPLFPVVPVMAMEADYELVELPVMVTETYFELSELPVTAIVAANNLSVLYVSVLP